MFNKRMHNVKVTKSKRMNEIVKPRLEVLSIEQINGIHEYAIQILETIGIKVECDEARNIFHKSGSVSQNGEIIFIKRELVDYALTVVPSRIDIFNKKGEHAFSLEENQENCYFGIGATNINFQDIETNKTRAFSRSNMQVSTKLGDILKNYDMISTLGMPHDVAPENIDLYNALDMYTNTDKPLILLVSDGNKMSEVFQLLDNLNGNISEKPFIIPYFNPISPLILNKTTTDKMLETINYNLPFIFSNYGMYGGTTPITEAGSMAVLTAELLAGLVFSQLIKKSSPIILGSLPAAFEMQTMGSYYSTSSYLMNLASAEMMRFYKIPHCGTSGSGIGRGPDLLASGDLWLNHLTSCIGKVGMVPFVGGNFDSTAFSPATVVLSDYIIGKAKKFAKGFILNDSMTNLKDIELIGHGGNYLTSEQTLESLYNADSDYNFWQSMNHDSWQSSGYPDTQKLLTEYTTELYNKAQNLAESNNHEIERGETLIQKIIKDRKE